MDNKSPLPFYPGSRPKPILAKDLEGNGRQQMFIFASDEDTTIDVKDDEAMTSPKKNKVNNVEEINLDPDRSSYQDRVNKKCCVVRVKNGYSPVLFFSIAYFISAFMFLLTINIPVLPNLYYPTIGNLLPLDMLHENPRRVLVLIVLWGMHFVRRFGEVLLIHIYKRGVPLYEAIGAIFYYGFFGFWIGWSINYHIEYLTPPNSIFLPGIFICLIGGVGNFICHLQLRLMRTGKWRKNREIYEHPRSKHVIPKGGCFGLISSPHYLFEIITWLGFALAAFTLASWAYFAAALCTLVFRSHKIHVAYKHEFNGQNGVPAYPARMKRLIPFIF